MAIVALALCLGLAAAFVIRAWKPRGRLSARDRWSLVTSCAVAVTTFAVMPLLVNWVVVPTAAWLAAVALLSGGVAGAALRWPELAWYTGTHPIRRALSGGATLASCALVIGVAAT